MVILLMQDVLISWQNFHSGGYSVQPMISQLELKNLEDWALNCVPERRYKYWWYSMLTVLDALCSWGTLLMKVSSACAIDRSVMNVGLLYNG